MQQLQYRITWIGLAWTGTVFAGITACLFVIYQEVNWRQQRTIARIEAALKPRVAHTVQEWTALRIELVNRLDTDAEPRADLDCLEYLHVAPPDQRRQMWVSLMDRQEKFGLEFQDELLRQGWQDLGADPTRLSADETKLIFRETRRWILASESKLLQLQTTLDEAPPGDKPGTRMKPTGFFPADFRLRREIRESEERYDRRGNLRFWLIGLQRVAHRAARRFQALSQTHPALDAAWRKSLDDPAVSADERARLLRWLEHGPTVPEQSPEDYERQYGMKPRPHPPDPWKE